MTKPRISRPEHLAKAKRLLDATAERRAEIARERAEQDIEDAADPEAAAHVRQTGLRPPERS